MLASVATFAIDGLDSREVTVEVDLRRGLPVFSVVGLPDRAVREARERVRAAIGNSGLDFPLQRLTANLAPASVRKAGPSFDLALAVAVLAASDQLPREGLDRYAVCGELSLSGRLRPVRGVLSISHGARTAGYDRLIVAPENAAEAALVDGIDVFPVPTLGRLSDLMHDRWEPDPAAPPEPPESREGALDLRDVRGQHDARRALEIAAAGGHNLVMIGPPGAGKTMLARRLPGILPPPTFEEALEITRVQSVAGLSSGRLAGERPFRAPHHTISASGLVGGGAVPRPGEVTLAHRGVLFLDELAEFDRGSLDALRQPLEEGVITIARARGHVRYPARFQLVAAMNPCRCGNFGDPDQQCRCPAGDAERYVQKVSGPFLDRVDLHVEMQRVPPSELLAGRAQERSAVVRERVAGAWQRAMTRNGGRPNAVLTGAAAVRACALGGPANAVLAELAAAAGMSARGVHRVLRVARSIADLADRDAVTEADVLAAAGLREPAAPWERAA